MHHVFTMKLNTVFVWVFIFLSCYSCHNWVNGFRRFNLRHSYFKTQCEDQWVKNNPGKYMDYAATNNCSQWATRMNQEWEEKNGVTMWKR